MQKSINKTSLAQKYGWTSGFLITMVNTMKKNILLLAFILFISCFNNNNPPSESTLPDDTTDKISNIENAASLTIRFESPQHIDTFYIAENDSSFFRIGIHENVIRNIFKNYQDTTFGATYVGIDGEGDGTLILKDTVPYFFFYSDDDSKRIQGYIFYYDKFHTRTGIHPSMTVGKLRRIYPNCKVGISMEFDSEFIYIPEEDISCELEFIPGVRAGDYSGIADPDVEETTKINLKAKIFSIFKN